MNGLNISTFKIRKFIDKRFVNDPILFSVTTTVAIVNVSVAVAVVVVASVSYCYRCFRCCCCFSVASKLIGPIYFPTKHLQLAALSGFNVSHIIITLISPTKHMELPPFSLSKIQLNRNAMWNRTWWKKNTHKLFAQMFE